MPRVDWVGREDALPPSALASLLAYLAVVGEWVTRQELANLPDVAEAGGLPYLRLSLHGA